MDDWGFEDFGAEAAAPPARADRELVPQGRHTFKIERAGEDATSLNLTLVHGDKRFGWVWANLTKGNDVAKRIKGSMLQALGLTPADWRQMDPGDLVGRTVDAEVYHRVGNTGKTFVNVRSFHATQAATAAALAQPEPKPAAARSQAAKAHQATTEANPDAIPF